MVKKLGILALGLILSAYFKSLVVFLLILAFAGLYVLYILLKLGMMFLRTGKEPYHGEEHIKTFGK
jgi:hypothetical protein